MKAVRFSASILAALAFGTSLAGTQSPAGADEAAFLTIKGYYTKLAGDFDSTVRSVPPLLNSPSGLETWSYRIVGTGAGFNGQTGGMLGRLEYEVAALKSSAACGSEKNELYGPYGSNFGLAALADDFARKLGDLYEARRLLESSQDKLTAKIADATLHNKPVDKLQNDVLAATRAALQRIESTYQDLIKTANSLMQKRNALASKVGGPPCTTSATKTPTPAPTKAAVAVATPTPTAPPKPQSVPTGPDKWEGTWVDGPPTTMSCGGDLGAGGADLQMRCVLRPKLGGGYSITVEGDFTLKCTLANPTTLNAKCKMTGKWHETNYDADMSGGVALQYDVGRRGFHSYWSINRPKATRMPPMGSYGPKVQVYGTYIFNGNPDFFLHR